MPLVPLPLLVMVSGMFDVVIIVGALDAGFVPVSAVRELCQAAKPGDQLTPVLCLHIQQVTLTVAAMEVSSVIFQCYIPALSNPSMILTRRGSRPLLDSH